MEKLSKGELSIIASALYHAIVLCSNSMYTGTKGSHEYITARDNKKKFQNLMSKIERIIKEDSNGERLDITINKKLNKSREIAKKIINLKKRNDKAVANCNKDIQQETEDAIINIIYNLLEK